MDISLRCVKGEEWPFTSFRALLDLAQEPSLASVTLSCPLSHAFTLEDALKKKVVSEEDADRILAEAQRVFLPARKEYEERKAEGWRARPSDYVPNEEVLALGWTCAKCPHPAAWSRSMPRREDRVLCLECRAGWDNFLKDHWDAVEIFWNGTSGRPRELFDDLAWERFLAGEPLVSVPEAEELLMAFRKQAKRESAARAKQYPKK